MSVSGAGKSGGSSSSHSTSSHSSAGRSSASHSTSKSTSKSTTSKTTSKTSTKSTKTSKATTKTAKKAYGANPRLAKAVKSIGIKQNYHARNKTTYCNQAVNAYASKLGYKGFKGLNANQMYSKMSKPGSGWHKATAAEAIAAAKAGKLTVAGWTGKVHGHVAAVIGEYSQGVPAIAQAGGHVTKTGKTVDNTFEYGSIKQTRANPSYFVHD